VNRHISFGIFWVISDSTDFEDYKLLCFTVHCDPNGNAIEVPPVQLNSKSGTSYNHRAMWDSQVKNNPVYKPYNKKSYNHYPRGRVEVSNNRAIIYLNPVLCHENILDEIKAAFGLTEESISSTRIVADNSAHYAFRIE
jgi:hypothetical protein